MIHVSNPEPLRFLKSRRRDTHYLDVLVAGLIGARNRETTALLAVFAELLVDDPAPQLRCRHELAQRDVHLPKWLTALPRLKVYRAVRRTHILGDVDELVIGTRLEGGQEMTVVVMIDHDEVSVVTDAVAVPDSIDKALARAAEFSTDFSVVDISPADARALIEHALDWQTFAPQTETWKYYGALTQWLVGQLPDAVSAGRRPGTGSRPRRCVTRSSHPQPLHRSVTSAIGSYWLSFLTLVRVTHCVGVRRVWNGCSTTRRITATGCRWK